MKQIKDKRKKYVHDWYIKNRNRILDKQKKTYIINKSVILLKNKLYREKNKHKLNITRNIYRRNRLKYDIGLRLQYNLRRRISHIIQNNYRLHTMEYIGCTLEQFKKHLEQQFKDGMTWENYGKLWHIDHCIPCANFDLTKVEEQKKCFHYTNMKPMLAKDNIRKGNRYSEPLILNTVI